MEYVCEDRFAATVDWSKPPVFDVEEGNDAFELHRMASLIFKDINDHDWLLWDQNVYIPSYAVHVIGSYTMNKAVKSGVIPPLMELLRGEVSSVEQRVSVRALGHLASYNRTFKAVAEYKEEIVNLAMHLASACLDFVYVKFIKVKQKKRSKYRCNLLTRGVDGFEMENSALPKSFDMVQRHVPLATYGRCLFGVCNALDGQNFNMIIPLPHFYLAQPTISTIQLDSEVATNKPDKGKWNLSHLVFGLMENTKSEFLKLEDEFSPTWGE